MPTFPRAAMVGAAATAVLLIAGTLLLVGGGLPTTTPSPMTDASRRPSLAPTPASSPSGVFAPLGYPGGGTIEFTRHDASGTDVLWLIDPSGKNATKVLDGACCGLFSPTGDQLALAAPGTIPGVGRDPSLIGVEVLDRPGIRVAFVVPTGCTACPIYNLNYEPDAWSPDGRYIAMAMWSDTDTSLDGMGIADRDFPQPWGWARLRATGAHDDIPIAFSPDSSQLLFMRQETTNGPTSIGPLFVIGVGSGVPRQISPEGVTVSSNGIQQGPASWSPDGRSIVFAGTDAAGRTSIYEAGVSPNTEATVIVDGATGASSARFSPDGSLIAYDVRSTGPFHDLYIADPSGNGPLNLTATFEPGVCCAQWSPDGRALLVAGTMSDDSHNDLFIVAADGSGIWQVTIEPNVYTGFLWGPGLR